MQTLSVSTTLVLLHFSSFASGKFCTTKTYSLLDTVDNDLVLCPQPGEPAHWRDCCGTASSRRCCADSRLFEDDDDRDPLWNTLHKEYDLDDIFDEDAAESRIERGRHLLSDYNYDLDDIEDATESRIEGGRHLLSAQKLRPTPQARIGRTSIGKFVGIIISIVVFTFIVILLCCCCIPCCFCAKKRSLNSGGVVHSQGPGSGQPQSGVQTSYSSPSQYPTQQHGPGQYPQQQQVPSPAQPPQPYSDLPPPYPGPPVQGYPPQMSAASGYPPQMSATPGYPPQMSGGYPPAPGYAEYAEKQPAFNPNMQ